MSLPAFGAAVQHWLGRDEAVRAELERQGLAELLTGARLSSAGFQAAAERHGVLGLIEGDTPQWTVATRALQARSMRALKFTRRAVEAVEAAGIACVVLKGVAAGARWRVPSARQQSDLDLLVTRGDQPAASKALIAAGVASHEFMAGEHMHNKSLKAKEPSGLTIELHHALNSSHEISVEIAELLARRVHLDTPQGRIPALAPEDDAAYLAMHAATHALTRLAWLVDLESLERGGVDWVEAARRARAWNIALPVECAWREVRELLAVPIPEAAFRELGTLPAQRLAIRGLYQATWATAGAPHVWLERIFRVALVPPQSWPVFLVHKYRARREDAAAYGY